jgi:hypothetical protein
MGASDVFVSVGGTATKEQEDFVCAVEDRLRIEGLIPHTVGRNTFSSDAPLKAVTELMRSCSGAFVIALERTYFPHGFDKPGGPKASPLDEIRLATPWNQIEATLAYVSNLPLLVIVEKGVRTEGLLEPGYDWYVQQIPLAAASLSTTEFNGVLASWKEKVRGHADAASSKMATSSPVTDPAQMSVGTLLGFLKPPQLWAMVTALAAVLAGAFSLGTHFAPHK